MNSLATSSQSTDEIYVTGDITVGKNEAVKPGIYDLSILGGSGNVTGDFLSVITPNIDTAKMTSAALNSKFLKASLSQNQKWLQEATEIYYKDLVYKIDSKAKLTFEFSK
ncbi:MAG: hypothetical protein LBI13_04385 [Streptococcaceae bacterium]|nr:hypothetical protein [Streptococcaceae bacterium]